MLLSTITIFQMIFDLRYSASLLLRRAVRVLLVCIEMQLLVRGTSKKPRVVGGKIVVAFLSGSRGLAEPPHQSSCQDILRGSKQSCRGKITNENTVANMLKAGGIRLFIKSR
jgi:hypothetical protein